MSKPPPASRPRQDKASQTLEKAVLALRMQRPDEAERLAASVLKGERDNVVATQVLGTALLSQNRAEDAVEALQKTALRATDPAIETLLAKALTAAGRPDEALDQLRRASERRPPYPLAFLDLGEGLGADGRFDEAVAVLETGLALIPKADGLRIALGYLHLKRNDRGRARRLFQQVRTAAPQRQDAMVGLAKVMVLDGEYAQAADLYRRALVLQPGDAATRLSLGKCLLEMGEREAGEAAIRAATHEAAQLAGPAITALAATSRGRFFLRPSAALKFLNAEAT
ncbi:lipopolysaccharide assembly protein LapB [Phenylobacterium sp. Root700]|uniref:tetratricopeptide repeat protein n=1 Tax=Phenylobacterium sp. Root700 TaxID=1736591 RepID=UPI000700DA61|nr:tetratricopeptide repeat protein [Phenylobacterium sp. Root700]KRB52555.1 hypothetical protein ASE02_11235 [Phenylobacterium sp. Root700]